METSQRVERPAAGRFKRLGWKVARITVLLYLGLCLVLFSLQNHLMFPGRSTQGEARAIIPPPTNGEYELIHLTTISNDTTVALFGPALDESGQSLTDATSRPTILFFYGNAMCLADCITLLRDLQRTGANVLIVEFVGYGMSTGDTSERTIYESAEAGWDYLQTRSNIDPNRIVPAGWSLGSAAAMELATRHRTPGLMLFSAFTSMPDMAHHIAPFLPTSVLVRARFDNAHKIAGITCPILLAHGTHDRVVPSEMLPQLVAAAKASSKVTHFTVDSDHGDLFDAPEVESNVRGFLQELPDHMPHPSRNKNR